MSVASTLKYEINPAISGGTYCQLRLSQLNVEIIRVFEVTYETFWCKHSLLRRQETVSLSVLVFGSWDHDFLQLMMLKEMLEE